jgi:hypothetical protein
MRVGYHTNRHLWNLWRSQLRHPPRFQCLDHRWQTLDANLVASCAGTETFKVASMESMPDRAGNMYFESIS